MHGLFLGTRTLFPRISLFFDDVSFDFTLPIHCTITGYYFESRVRAAARVVRSADGEEETCNRI